MPYCSSCKAEYRPNISICADCDVVLSEDPPDVYHPQRMADVYICSDVMMMSRALEVLSRSGLEVLHRDFSSSCFPTMIEPAQQKLSVAFEHWQEAHDVLNGAMKEGLIADGGILLRQPKFL